ncbi:MAG: HAMP domain-containing protein [Nocardioides sp.]|nr:HAMP domain-containing protein [Nocardioides sp.]
MRSRWGTVRARTTLLATAATALALVAGSVALVLTLQSQLTGRDDTLAQSRVRELMTAARAGDLPTSLDSLGGEGVGQVIAADGTVLAASPNVEGRPPLVPVATGGSLKVRSIDGPDDDEIEHYRVWVGAGPSPDGAVTVVVGTSAESVAETTRTLRGALLVGVPILVLLLAAAIWAFVGRALGRIDKITTAVAGIGESELDRRVPVPAADDEVRRLAETMNTMLARLEAASARQRDFVADASHDLQSPLAALRAQLEIARAHPERPEMAGFAADLLVSTSEMEQLVGDLLYLAVEDGVRRPAVVLLDLDDVVLEEAVRVRPDSPVHIDTGGVSAAPVRGDPAALRRLVRNLLDNAVRHAVARVTLTLAGGVDEVVLDVVDDGPGVATVDRDRVFDRFYRADPARPGHAGSGLGLAIAAEIAQRHGGRLTLEDDAPGAHLRLTLPGPVTT